MQCRGRENGNLMVDLHILTVNKRLIGAEQQRTIQPKTRKDEISEEDNLFRHLAAAAPQLKIDKMPERKSSRHRRRPFFAPPKTNLRR